MLTATIQKIPLEQIRPHPDNRTVGGFDPVKLRELADSIEDVGVLQPITVRFIPAILRTKDAKYELVAGERRWRASKLAGQADIPAIVRDLDDVQVLKIQTVENLQREDVHPLDEADGYARLIEKAGYAIEQIAEELGKSASYVYQRLKLRDLIEPARKLLVDGKITAGHAILIARLGTEQQEETLKELTLYYGDEIMPVRELDEWIHGQILMELSKVTWKLEDADLVPSAGSCTACPKRAGYQPLLFADVCNGKKKDYCTDRVCFASKQEAVVERKKAELAGTDFLEVSDGYSHRKAGVIPQYQWTECKKKDPGAKRALVVEGTSPGRLTWGTKEKTRVSAYTPSAAEKAAETKRKQELALATAYRKDLWGEIFHREEIDAWPPQQGIFRLVVSRMFTRLESEYAKQLCKLHFWEANKGKYGSQDWHEAGRKQIADVSVTELLRLAVECALIGDLTANQWDTRGPETLEACAGILEINSKAVKARVQKALKEKQDKKLSSDLAASARIAPKSKKPKGKRVSVPEVDPEDPNDEAEV